MAKSRPSILFSVDLFGCFDLRLGDCESCPIIPEGTEETGVISFMTSLAPLLDLYEQSIRVTIEGDVFYDLSMAAALTFHPELLP